MCGREDESWHVRVVKKKTPETRTLAKPLTWMLENQNATTGIFLVMMAVLGAIALGIGTWLTRDGEMLDETTSAVLFTTPVVLPIGIAAVMGGLVVHRRGWIPALGLSVGMGVGVVGQLTDEIRLFQLGAAAFGLSILGFWVVGWIARFPMWIGFGQSKWVEVQRPEEVQPDPDAKPIRTWIDEPSSPKDGSTGKKRRPTGRSPR